MLCTLVASGSANTIVGPGKTRIHRTPYDVASEGVVLLSRKGSASLSKFIDSLNVPKQKKRWEDILSRSRVFELHPNGEDFDIKLSDLGKQVARRIATGSNGRVYDVELLRSLGYPGKEGSMGRAQRDRVSVELALVQALGDGGDAGVGQLKQALGAEWVVFKRPLVESKLIERREGSDPPVYALTDEGKQLYEKITGKAPVEGRKARREKRRDRYGQLVELFRLFAGRSRRSFAATYLELGMNAGRLGNLISTVPKLIEVKEQGRELELTQDGLEAAKIAERTDPEELRADLLDLFEDDSKNAVERAPIGPRNRRDHSAVETAVVELLGSRGAMHVRQLMRLVKVRAEQLEGMIGRLIAFDVSTKRKRLVLTDEGRAFYRARTGKVAVDGVAPKPPYRGRYEQLVELFRSFEGKRDATIFRMEALAGLPERSVKRLIEGLPRGLIKVRGRTLRLTPVGIEIARLAAKAKPGELEPGLLEPFGYGLGFGSGEPPRGRRNRDKTQMAVELALAMGEQDRMPISGAMKVLDTSDDQVKQVVASYPHLFEMERSSDGRRVDVLLKNAGHRFYRTLLLMKQNVAWVAP